MAAPLAHDTVDYDYCLKPDRDWNNSSLPALPGLPVTVPQDAVAAAKKLYTGCSD